MDTGGAEAVGLGITPRLLPDIDRSDGSHLLDARQQSTVSVGAAMIASPSANVGSVSGSSRRLAECFGILD